jgi:hypothetical protein
MPKKKEATDVPAEPAKKAAPESALVTAAKIVGEAAGKIATAIGVAKPTNPPKPKVPKLAKKKKPRLPRRQKKAAAKKAARQLDPVN